MNLPFTPSTLSPKIVGLLEAGDLLRRDGPHLVSKVRFSSIEGGLYAHSAFPTDAVDSVFLGPDTHRFCRAIRLAQIHARVVVDVGCGSGAGGIVAGRGASEVILSDISPRALAFSRVNAELNRVSVRTVTSNLLTDVRGEPDLIVSNPPYLRDALGRTYRDGGGDHGEALSVRIVDESLTRLAPGGTLLLYTGTAVVDGEDRLLAALRPVLESARVEYQYDELDPDVFGEELAQPAYAGVDRIAIVLLRLQR